MILSTGLKNTRHQKAYTADLHQSRSAVISIEKSWDTGTFHRRAADEHDRGIQLQALALKVAKKSRRRWLIENLWIKKS